ncbi:MAG: zinc-binding dehydrogenase, partial [Acidimicrobiales bacterium]|nr:zinc-binding dehydrogenase [Acidimicrobiales bacterium]
PVGSRQDVPGLELAGEVVEVGSDVSGFQVRDRVMAVVGGGAQGELIAIDVRHAIKISEGVSFTEAGGFPEVFSTAYDALFKRARVGLGTRCLITGASGGVGTAAIQLAKNAGAYVVATTRHEVHFGDLLAFGADEVVEPAATEEVEALGPFDVVLELVSGNLVRNHIDSLAQGGTLVVIGVGGGSKIEIDLLTIMNKRAFITGSTLRSRTGEEKMAVAQSVAKNVVPLLGRGGIKVPVANVFPIEHAALAYEEFAKGGKLGKIILTIG